MQAQYLPVFCNACLGFFNTFLSFGECFIFQQTFFYVAIVIVVDLYGKRSFRIPSLSQISCEHKITFQLRQSRIQR